MIVGMWHSTIKVFNVICNEHMTELFDAVKNNDTVATRRLLRTGWNANLVEKCQYDGMETSLLSTACDFGGDSNAMVQLLLEHNADVNLRDLTATVALHIAAISGKDDAVRLMIQVGADVHAKCILGNTPLIMCTRPRFVNNSDCRRRIAENLIVMGADINAVNNDDECCLHYAAQGGDIEMVDFLIKKGAKTEIKDNWGRTAEMRAHMNRHTAVAGLISRRIFERVRRRKIRISKFLVFVMGNFGRFKENSYVGLLPLCVLPIVLEKLRILDDD